MKTIVVKPKAPNGGTNDSLEEDDEWSDMFD